MRVIACYLFVLFFSCYAYKRWYISLCAALAMMAAVEHPDMPKSIAGIQGLSPWNILMANVLSAWWIDRSREGRRLDYPPRVWGHFILVMTVMMIAVARLLISPGVLGQEESFSSMVSEYVINCIKWVLPGILLFDGCRDRKSAHLAIASILVIYFLLAVQTIRWMPLSAIASGGDLSARASKITQNEIGYNRVTLSMMLAGASWATATTLLLVKGWWARVGILVAAGAILFGQALTGGRTGYVSWMLVGVVLGMIRWRKLLLLLPIAAMLVLTLVPQVRERLFQGIAADSGPIQAQNDAYSMTSGRNIAWPYAIDKIQESPIIGFGRHGMVTSGVRDSLWDKYRESFPHPHNAYLEIMLDAGVIGFGIVVTFFGRLLLLAHRLLRDRSDPILTVAGGMCIALILALLFGSLGGQTFYPREGSVGMWAAIGFMLRLVVQQHERDETGSPLFPDDLPQVDAGYEPVPQTTVFA